MRTLNRNKRTLYYKLYLGEVENTDGGDLTGESTPAYGQLNELRCNVSASVGADAISAFGGFTNYTRTIAVSDVSCPMDEDSIVWFGVPLDQPYNYIVTKRADSKNGILYALLEVKVQ